jgi:hypothetical protein
VERFLRTFHNAARRLEKIARPAVIPQSLPQLQDIFLVRPGEIRHGGETGNPPQKIGNTPFHLGLLKHDLRDENFVGIIGPPPGKIPMVCGKPFHKNVSEFGKRHLRPKGKRTALFRDIHSG